MVAQWDRAEQKSKHLLVPHFSMEVLCFGYLVPRFCRNCIEYKATKIFRSGRCLRSDGQLISASSKITNECTQNLIPQVKFLQESNKVIGFY